MSTNGFIGTVGELTQAVLAPAADLLEPVAGEASWGWSVILVGALWRVLTWPWLVRSAQRRIDRQAQAADPDSVSGSDPAPESTPRSAFGMIGTGFTLLQVLLIAVIALWSRTGPAAADASFYGLSTLSTSPVFLGLGGIAWAVALAALGAAGGVMALRAADVDDERQWFFARYMAPVIFLCLGLFLPAAMVLPFVTAMTLSLLAAGQVARRTPLRVEVAA